MRNLKRVLTMIMAAAMIMSLMVVGAGATAFTDDKDIQNKDAVDKMVALNIIIGKEGNKFDPAAIVTRAEMAKMIYVALNGGVDQNKDSAPNTAVASFKDTKGHWAQNYIEYCVNLKIIAGNGDGTFAPDKGVTGSEAGKMLLVALGYDATQEKLIGASWALNTNTLAQRKTIYDGLSSLNYSEALSRDNAALMVDNFSTATMVTYENSGFDINNGLLTGVNKTAKDLTYFVNSTEYPETVVHKYYKLQSLKGTMSSVSYDSKKKEYGYEVTYKDSKDATTTDTFYTATDFTKFMGAKVEVMWRNKEASTVKYDRNVDSVYDINMDGGQIIASGVMTDLDKYDVKKDTLKFNGTTYDVVGDLFGQYAYNGKANDLIMTSNAADSDKGQIQGAAGSGTANDPYKGDGTAIATPYNINLIDNDNDDEIDAFVVIPFTVQKVTYVGNDTLTFAYQGSSDQGSAGSKDKKDVNSYDGIAKDDIVAYYSAANAPTRKDTVQKLDKKTATVAETRVVNSVNEYKLDGVWYTSRTTTTIKAGDKIDFIAIGTQIFYAKVTEYEATTRNVLAIYNNGYNNSDFNNNAGTAKAKAIFGENGTKKDINVAKVDKTELTDTNYDDLLVVGKMFSYKINSDDEYELTSLVDGENVAGHDGFKAVTGGNAYNDKKLAGYEISDKATILFVDKTNNKADSYTGAEIKRNYGGQKLFDSAYVLFDKIDGFNYATVATIVGDELPKITSGMQYGYLLSNAGTTVRDGKTYGSFRVWTTTGEKNLIEKETSSLSEFTKGQVITYNIETAGTGTDAVDVVKDVSLPENLFTGRVATYDESGKKRIELATADGTTAQYEIDENTQIFNIDSKNKDGEEGNRVEISDTVLNAYYIINSEDKKVDLLVVGVDGEIPALGNAVVKASAVDTAAKLNALLEDYTNVTINGNITLGDASTATEVVVKANQTLTVKGDLTMGDHITLKVDGKLIAQDGNTAKNITVDATGALNVGEYGSVTANDITSVINAGTVTANNIITTATVAAGTVKTTGNITNLNVIGNATINTVGITTIAGNAGTITATGNIGAITTNAGKINAEADITTISINLGTINVEKNAIVITEVTNGAEGIINFAADATITTLAGTGTINVAAGKTLTITNAAPMAALNKIVGKATSVLTLTGGSSDSYLDTMKTFYTVAADGTQCTTATNLTAPSAYTYKDSNTTADNDQLAWVANS